MNEKNVSLNEMKVTGLSIRTNNNQLEKIGKLWNDFLSDDISSKIPDKINPQNLFVIYTDYESDHTGNYLCLIGFEVKNFSDSTKNFTNITIPKGYYKNFNKTGNARNIVPKMWEQIWQNKINRVYKSDFEVYDLQTMNSENTEVNIFIGIKK